MIAEQALYSLSYTSSPFCSGCFEDGVSGTICPCWPQTMFLPVSPSHVAKNTGASHWCLAKIYIFYSNLYILGSTFNL
jgi:hypothetical protein